MHHIFVHTRLRCTRDVAMQTQIAHFNVVAKKKTIK